MLCVYKFAIPCLNGVVVLSSGQSGRTEGDVDHKELLSQRFWQRLSSSLHHHTGEPLQVSSNIHPRVHTDLFMLLWALFIIALSVFDNYFLSKSLKNLK